MNREDDLVLEAFARLGPTSERVAAMEHRVLDALDARRALEPASGGVARALAAEWLELLATRPVANTALVAAAAAMLLLTTPLALLPFALLG